MSGNELAPPRFDPLGEQAVSVSFADAVDERAERRVARLVRRLQAFPFPGYREVVPAYATLCVYFDAVTASTSAEGSVYEAVCRWIEERCRSAEAAEIDEPASRRVEIPICYCPRCGPDLAETAASAGLLPGEAASLHAASTYRVSMIGFMPGFPYMNGLPSKLHASRLATPRKTVPAGSVAIAGERTGIYPATSPGGWRLIGRTCVALFQPERSPPSFLEAGDSVVFVPTTHDRIERGLRRDDSGH
ncbi:5-oxoprolinase subunit PxpB [Paenibacillus sp. TRM 82003]|nr:5-oxoprolinase subunit PxpB [Paenibacillus sp. TRM 82003]